METNKKYHGFLTVDYEDGDASTYKGLNLSLGDTVKRFDTGDPLIDWYDYCKYVYDGDARKNDVGYISYSSNVDHWFMDSKKYVEKYLKYMDDHYEFMTNEDIYNMSFSDLKEHIKCVVTKRMKSFNDLKVYYKKNMKI